MSHVRIHTLRECTVRYRSVLGFDCQVCRCFEYHTLHLFLRGTKFRSRTFLVAGVTFFLGTHGTRFISVSLLSSLYVCGVLRDFFVCRLVHRHTRRVVLDFSMR